MVENLRLLRKQVQDEIASAKVPTAKYGIEPGGGGELTQTEACADRLLRLRQDLNEITNDIINLELLLTRLKSATDTLDASDKTLVELRYGSRLQWAEIAERTGYSERQAKRRAYRAVRQICRQLFGYKQFYVTNFWFVR